MARRWQRDIVCGSQIACCKNEKGLYASTERLSKKHPLQNSQDEVLFPKGVILTFAR